MQRRRSGTQREMIAEAIALFVRNEAALLAQVAATNKAMAEGEKRHGEWKAAAEARFARIEADLEQIKAMLRRQERMLADLPEAIRQKIGFQPKP